MAGFRVLVVGAADTGRAPMAAALLRRIAERHGLGWDVASAGVLGHDGAPAEPEARAAMLMFGLDIDAHRARLLDDALIAASTRVVAVDSGTAKVVVARFPQAAAQLDALGDLAGRSRDVPDPFRMQVGAWVAYARELEAMLELAVESLMPAPRTQSAGEAVPAPRTPMVARAVRILALLVELPEVIAWAAARPRLESELAAASEQHGDLDMAPAYAGLLRAALVLSASPPSTGQAAALLAAVRRLERPIAADDLAWLSAQIGGWTLL